MKKITLIVSLAILFVFAGFVQTFADNSSKIEKAKITKKEQKKLLDKEKLKNMSVDELRDLISRGADINIKDKEGNTPLFYVLDGKKTKEESEQMVEKVKLLIEAGADVNAKNNTFWTPLHYATGSLGNVEAKSKIVVMLVDAGADINAQSDTGVTSINWTIEPKIVPLLLKLKADPNIADSNGETTLGHAEAQVDFWDTQVLLNVTKNDIAGVREAKKFKNLFETKVKILKSECEKLDIELK